MLAAREKEPDMLRALAPEADNSREIAMNRAGVTIVHIGRSDRNLVCGRPGIQSRNRNQRSCKVRDLEVKGKSFCRH